jgi:hypothetical protein
MTAPLNPLLIMLGEAVAGALIVRRDGCVGAVARSLSRLAVFIRLHSPRTRRDGGRGAVIARWMASIAA